MRRRASASQGRDAGDSPTTTSHPTTRRKYWIRMCGDYERRVSVVTIITGSASSAGESTKTARLNYYIKVIRHEIRWDYGGCHCTAAAARTALGGNSGRKRSPSATTGTTAPNAH